MSDKAAWMDMEEQRAATRDHVATVKEYATSFLTGSVRSAPEHQELCRSMLALVRECEAGRKFAHAYDSWHLADDAATAGQARKLEQAKAAYDAARGKPE